MWQPCMARLDLPTRKCGAMPWMSTPGHCIGSSSTPGFTNPSSGSSTPVLRRSLGLPCGGVLIYPRLAKAAVSTRSPRRHQVSLPPFTSRPMELRQQWRFSSIMSQSDAPAPSLFRRSARLFPPLCPIHCIGRRFRRSPSTATGALPEISCGWRSVPLRLASLGRLSSPVGLPGKVATSSSSCLPGTDSTMLVISMPLGLSILLPLRLIYRKPFDRSTSVPARISLTYVIV